MSINLSSGSIEIQLDAERGTIQRLVHHRFGIDLITEPRLAANFRLLAPLKEWRGHYIYGRQQKLKDCRRTANGLELVYGPLISSAGEFDIRLVFSIVVDQDDVQFSYEIENHSGTQIEEVILPLIGGLANESEDEAWRFFSTDLLGKGKEWRFYKDFPGTYLGPAKPIWFGPYPHQSVLPWVDIYHPGRRVGFYLGCHNPQADWSSPFLELTPSTCYRKGGQRWPHRSDLPSDQPLGLTMGWATFPFVNPGETKVGPPVVAHFHEGTWYAAADYYRNWFQQHWPVNRKTSWLGREDAWQSNIISYPEDSVMFRFADLPKLAREAARRGIHVMQVDGWDLGGIDRDYPYYSPDPRLGTSEELRAAIKACADLGVGIMIFANLTVANIETEWYRKELYQYASRDPRGFARNSMGWEYHTLLGLAQQVESRMVFMNPSHMSWAEIMLKQLTGIVDLGAPGIQIDKVHGFTPIDFYAPEGLTPSRSMPEGILQTLKRFRSAALNRNPEFGLASETHWDRAIPLVDAAYARYFELDHLPAIGYSFPEFRQSCAVPGRTDRPLVNNSLRFGHIINVEPSYLHGAMADAAPLDAYVAEVLRLRRSLKDVLWDSKLVEPLDLELDHDGVLLASVHQSIGGKRRAVVITHLEEKERSGEIKFAAATKGTIYQPFEEPQEVRLPLTFKLPADGVAVLVVEAYGH
jgi:hypothetical protein